MGGMQSNPNSFKTPEPGSSYMSQKFAADPALLQRCNEIRDACRAAARQPGDERQNQVVDDLGPSVMGVIVY